MEKTELHHISQNEQSTVMAKFVPSNEKEKHFESENELEQKFIKILQNNGYEYVNIKNEKDLIVNLKIQMQRLNDCEFNENEWGRFFKQILANPSHNARDKSSILHLDEWDRNFTFDNGKMMNLKIIDKHNIQNNFLQVINQYEAQGIYKNRYDVSILINGLPLVHIELKKRGKNLKEAFNQIVRYGRESFWSGNALFEWVQIFVISNGTYTKYYSNTTRKKHCKEQDKSTGKKSSHNYEFTIFWADMQNEQILDLNDFAKSFFARHTLLNVLIKYSVFDTNKNLLIMRPYQIAASEAIERKVKTNLAYKKYGSLESCGYIWHSTGSGKTLTSFKTAQLLTQIKDIEKVLFVVDRRDLDSQTIQEYEKFQKDCVKPNASTKELEKQLSNESAKIIVTTIQKLSNFVRRYHNHSLLNKPCVIIFDECHRSQFGNMQKDIKNAFKKYMMFGFTGTPIFEQNAKNWRYSKEFDSVANTLITTRQIFNECLHSYTLANAIRDKNVLPFKVSYHSTVKQAENIEDEEVKNIAKEKALRDIRRIEKISAYILESFDKQTMRNKHYSHDKRALSGFNAMLACADIDMAKLYYTELKRQMQDLSEDSRLKIGIIYSYGANNNYDEDDGEIKESDKEFLSVAINDYNAYFGSHFNIERFYEYYANIGEKMKNRELDLLIVVNMFLTGFDATTLNTLWVDKNLQYQGLLQAFSRTNRIVNSIKTFGNVICFRDLEAKTNESISLFSARGDEVVVLLKSFREYLEGFTDEKDKYHRGYKEVVSELHSKFSAFEKIAISGTEEEKKAFINLYNELLKLHNILNTFEEFKNEELLSEGEKLNLQSAYLQIYEEIRKKRESEATYINDDLVFELELIKQVDINFDYILGLIEKINGKSRELREKEFIALIKLIDSSLNLHSKKDLIKAFINSINPQSDVIGEFGSFIESKMKEELNALIVEFELDSKASYDFINKSFEIGYIEELGEDIEKILPPMGFFGAAGEKRRALKPKVLSALRNFYERFKDISRENLSA